jgi:hypothetical protein
MLVSAPLKNSQFGFSNQQRMGDAYIENGKFISIVSRAGSIGHTQ